MTQGVLFANKETELTNESRKAGLPSEQPLSNTERKELKRERSRQLAEGSVIPLPCCKAWSATLGKKCSKKVVFEINE